MAQNSSPLLNDFEIQGFYARPGPGRDYVEDHDREPKELAKDQAVAPNLLKKAWETWLVVPQHNRSSELLIETE